MATFPCHPNEPIVNDHVDCARTVSKKICGRIESTFAHGEVKSGPVGKVAIDERRLAFAQIPLGGEVVAPPPGVDFGVQKGRGSRYETMQLQRSTGADLCFTVTLPAKLSGPFVQGPPRARSPHLNIGS